MSLSRTDSRRPLPSLLLSKWMLLGILLLLLAVALMILYIRSADSGYRKEENRAIAVAMEQGGLTEIDAAVLYTWDQPVWIVMGKDKDNENWILWERSDGIVKEKMKDGFSEKKIREKFAAERPSGDPVRVLPGWFAGQPVWEIRYKKAKRSQRQAIDFFSFKDGTLLKTYELPG